MSTNIIFELFTTINIKKIDEKYLIYKPLIILYALSKCYLDEERMIAFPKINYDLSCIVDNYFDTTLLKNFHYAFGRLESDNIWEIDNSNSLFRSSSGDLSKTELLQKNVCGGFISHIFKALQNDKILLLSIVNHILETYFPQEQHASLLSVLNFVNADNLDNPMIVSDLRSTYENNKPMNFIHSDIPSSITRQNGYIAYLNSLHNLAADGANALAESQALNHYFAGIYQAFPLVEDLYQALTDGQERVIVLTGHAGDGKSTVALDVFKQLKQLPADQPLNNALNEREDIVHARGNVSIIKDMSELTAQQRLAWLDQGFSQSGSWLIVSNTGPLINSLADYVQTFAGPPDIESEILERLDRPYELGQLVAHRVSGFTKELIIINMTRLDNVSLGAKVLTKLVQHPAWQQCGACTIEANCPLRLNRDALLALGAIAEQRVRWIYQRLTAYEQRLTLRQMVAHLALSLTGGMSCDWAQESVAHSNTLHDCPTENLSRILFSETFFGYRRGEPWKEAENLRAISLLKRSVFGGPIAVDYERQLLQRGHIENLELPEILNGVQQRWREQAMDATGVRWRFSLRRLFYMFGKPSSTTYVLNQTFLATFLQSPKLIQFNDWQNSEGRSLESKENDKEKRRLLQKCLQVLLEIYSGFSANQFEGNDYLYLTLRRSDQVVIQPTQLIIGKLAIQDFSLSYDVRRRMPKLVYRGSVAELNLTLPLLDYIHYRSIGLLGNQLSPIHLAQLEWFRAELLKNSSALSIGEISLLRSSIDGKAKMYRLVIDEQKQELEKY